MAIFKALSVACLAYSAPAFAENATSDATPNAYEENPETMCKNVVNESDDPTCYTNVTWAMMTGIYTKKEYYVNYTTLTNMSSRLDFQCALASMVGNDEAGSGHSCPVPCTSTLPQCAGEITETAGTDGSASSGMQWWAWLLIALALLACLGGLAYYMLVMRKDAPKKKKRAVKAPAPPAAPAAAPVESVLVAPPVYVTSARVAVPTMTAAPVYAAAAPVYTATPVQTSSVVVPSTSSFVATAAPVMVSSPSLV